MSSGLSTLSTSFSLYYVPFALDVYVHDYDGYLDAERFCAMFSNGDAITIYNTINGVDCGATLDARVRRWRHWGGRSAVLRSDDM